MDLSLSDALYQSLKGAAEQGSIDGLYALIRRNANVLDSMDKIPFVDTPLHIAASLGHTQFAMEIIKLKPSFARKLNQDGFSPMHLALQKLHELENNPDLQRNQTQLVNRLIDVDRNLVRVQGRENVTPLHYVAQIGNPYFLARFFKACPESLEDVTIRNENVLHITLKYDMFIALSRLLRWLEWACFKDAELLEEKLLDSQDEDGNTLLHIAVSKNQPKVVSRLLDRGLVDLKAKNLEGKTVFDILEQHGTEADYQQMRDMLLPPCVSRLRATVASILIFPVQVLLWKRAVRVRRLQTAMTDDRRNALLVVAALLLTVTFQAGLGPPGEVRKTRKNPYDRLFHKNSYIAWEEKNALNGNTFLLFNTITYYLTTLTIFFLVPPDLIGFQLYLLLLLLFCCYFYSPRVYNFTVTFLASDFLIISLFVLTSTIPATHYWLVKKISSNKEDVFVEPV